MKRRQYLCSNSTRLGEPLRNSLLVLRQMLGNLLIRGRVLSAFAGRKNTAATFFLHQLGSGCSAQPHGCVGQRAICMSKENSFQRQQSCGSAWQPWEMRGNKPGWRDRSPPPGFPELALKEGESGAFTRHRQGVCRCGAGLGHGADPPGDTLPSTARDGGLRGAGGIRIGSLAR